MEKVRLKVNHLIPRKEMQNNYTQEYTDVSYIYQYLMNLGIPESDVISFIDRPRDTDEDNPMMLDNIRAAVDTAWYELTHNAKVFVIVDSDTDGFTSSSILINYLRRRFPDADIKYALHPGKEHGIVLEDIPADRTLIFVPDAGSNNFAEQEQLIKEGKKVIILDHHEINNNDFYDTGAIVVNNQSSIRFSNKNLSGAGIVYMFIKLMDAVYYPSNEIYRDYMDLAAIGIIADAMNMTALGNNYLAYHGLRNIKSPFIKELARKQSHGIKNPDLLTKIDVAFYIAPVINGVIRSGSTEDKEMVFKAMSEEHSDEIFTTVWRGNERHENLYQYAVRLAANAKSRQDSAKRNSFELLCQKIKDEHLDQDNLIIVTLDEKESKKVSPTITGLIAMELVKEFNKPCLVLRKTELDGVEVYGGSGRNGNFYGLPDLKGFCQSYGVYYGEGHANAFGCFLLPEQVQGLRDFANAHLNSQSFEMIYDVDYWFKHRQDIDYEMLFEFASFEELWGNSLPQPKFCATFDYMKSDVIIMGKDKSSVKIKCDNISFVAFKNAELAAKLEKTPFGVATIVGRPQLNEWNGNVSLQVVIDDIEIEEKPAVEYVNNLYDLI